MVSTLEDGGHFASDTRQIDFNLSTFLLRGKQIKSDFPTKISPVRMWEQKYYTVLLNSVHL